MDLLRPSIVDGSPIQSQGAAIKYLTTRIPPNTNWFKMPHKANGLVSYDDFNIHITNSNEYSSEQFNN